MLLKLQHDLNHNKNVDFINKTILITIKEMAHLLESKNRHFDFIIFILLKNGIISFAHKRIVLE